ncbi:4-hydroxyphenylpyruvate dioxygenase [Bacteriovorax sp. BSW11_IV]|uniref:4-hydroxyphenylpyruvate dioxygenase n=1 Tax=Bacteriovorax sp. BSW11_IV TaxID=1353529 RepID=UPI00038A2FB2|nr:4-hydroxyphenylpyruvate dioxygenase [Bacteriovorax sp. BSW11_IV]EQC50236.1 4-hydroxyphenylpyruvate dioxygenase [Bacteriovorax sp. BSW11_IV]
MNSQINEKNPLGILAIDHLEFTCDSLGTKTKELFYTMGFAKTAQNTELETELFTQGQVRFLLSASTNKETHSRKYFDLHGEGVSTMSFLVEDAEHAITEAAKRGAEVVSPLKTVETADGVFRTASIKGFGDVLNEFVERPRESFRPNYESIENDPKAKPLRSRVARIDHLTNNVPKGEMTKWVEFYKRVYGMEVTRYFDIKGAKTGLQSEVVQLANSAVIIPINEPDADNGKSQIQEFLDLHKGSGVQHIALTCGDIITTVMDLRERGMKFLNIPHTYYEDIPKRGLNVTEDVNVLEEAQLLVDGDSEGYLIQNFSETYVGPLFFEYIQRKKHYGFGEGNFQALFDAIERDQMKRGYL